MHLGYFPEGAGEHYVSLNVTGLPPELHDFSSGSNLHSDNSDELLDTADLHDMHSEILTNPDSSQTDNEAIFEEVYSNTDNQSMATEGGQNHISTEREHEIENDAYSDTDTIIYSLDNVDISTGREHEIEQPLPMLPPLVLHKIFQYCLEDDLLSVFTLKEVCHNFSELLKEANPRVYISPQTMGVVPNILSV